MTTSVFASAAAEVRKELQARREGRPLRLVKPAATDRDAEWQRVNSYIADVLKDTHVLYAKLARLQGDFVGRELEELEQISESVLGLGEELSQFSKAFYEGKLSMAEADAAYGTPGAQQAPPAAPPAPPAAPPEVPIEVEEAEAPEEPEEEQQ